MRAESSAKCQLQRLTNEESKRRKFSQKKENVGFTKLMQKFRNVWLHFYGTIHAIQRKSYRGGDFGQRKIHLSINDGHNHLFSFPVFPQFWLPAQLLKRVFFE